MESSWILIIGAGSDIAMATARKFAARGNNLYLAAHHPEELRAFAHDLAARNHITASVLPFDVTDVASHPGFLGRLPVPPRGVLLAAGYAGDARRAERDPDEARRILEVNFSGCVSVLEACAASFERRGGGFIAAMSSVAGDRGRRSNYLYGAAKAGLTAYLSGLRARLASKGVTVITILPGIVLTKMTNVLLVPPFLAATPDRVARDIIRAIDRRTPVIYTPWWWRWVMAGIKLIPERIFMRMFHGRE